MTAADLGWAETEFQKHLDLNSGFPRYLFFLHAHSCSSLWVSCYYIVGMSSLQMLEW